MTGAIVPVEETSLALREVCGDESLPSARGRDHTSCSSCSVGVVENSCGRGQALRTRRGALIVEFLAEPSGDSDPLCGQESVL